MEVVGHDGLAMSFPHDLTGTRLDQRYQITRVLGRGGMGFVYEATHVVLGRTVAIKVLHPRFAHEERFRERFIREAQSASRIRHRNIVEITDFGETPDDSVYFVMEFLEGRDLGDELKEIGVMPWPRARHILLQVVGALGAAHAEGIIHRDIKPANCFLTRDRQEGQSDLVKVVDFGIAKIASDSREDEQGRGLTGTGEVFGTVTYMSPEQAQGKKLDARSDMYSLGVTAYRMLTGVVPFTGVNVIHVINRHITEAPEPLRTVQPEVPEAVERLVLKMIAKSPEERYASMEALEAAIRGIAEDGSETGAGTGAGTGTEKRRGRRTREWTGARMAGMVEGSAGEREVSAGAASRSRVSGSGTQETTFRRPSPPALPARAFVGEPARGGVGGGAGAGGGENEGRRAGEASASREAGGRVEQPLRARAVGGALGGVAPGGARADGAGGTAAAYSFEPVALQHPPAPVPAPVPNSVAMMDPTGGLVVAGPWGMELASTGPLVRVDDSSAETSPQSMSVVEDAPISGRMIAVAVCLVFLVGGGSAMVTLLALSMRAEARAATVAESADPVEVGTRLVGDQSDAAGELGRVDEDGSAAVAEQGVVVSREDDGTLDGDVPTDGSRSVGGTPVEVGADDEERDELIMLVEDEDEDEDEDVPSAPSPRRASHESAECETVRETAETAYELRSWGHVVQQARRSRCWPAAKKSRRQMIYVRALLELKRFSECVEAGRRAHDPSTLGLVAVCEEKATP